VVAYIFYHYLQMRIDNYTTKLQENVLVFTNSL
jgi:hypothetical protein